MWLMLAGGAIGCVTCTVPAVTLLLFNGFLTCYNDFSRVEVSFQGFNLYVPASRTVTQGSCGLLELK